MRPFLDVARINEVANDPTIRPFIGGGLAYLDLSAVVVEPNMALFGDHGGFCLSWTSPGTYEVHTMILPKGRGKWAFDFAKCAIEYCKSQGIKTLWTRVHPKARHTLIFAKKTGFIRAGMSTINFATGPVEYYSFERSL